MQQIHNYRYRSKLIFENVEYENEIYDRGVNLKGLHTVRKKVEWSQRASILPNHIWKKYSDMEFWRNSVKKKILQGQYEILVVPNIVNITYGRDVGYKIEQEVFDDIIHNILATKIRKEMGIE